MVEKNAGKKRKIGKYEKNVPTRPVDRKQKLFLRVASTTISFFSKFFVFFQNDELAKASGNDSNLINRRK